MKLKVCNKDRIMETRPAIKSPKAKALSHSKLMN